MEKQSSTPQEKDLKKGTLYLPGTLTVKEAGCWKSHVLKTEFAKKGTLGEKEENFSAIGLPLPCRGGEVFGKESGPSKIWAADRGRKKLPSIGFGKVRFPARKS